MTKCYYFRVTLIRNGKVVAVDRTNNTFTNKPLEKKEIPLTWDNIDEYYRKYGLMFGWGLSSARKGKVTWIPDGWGYSTRIKEWKEPNLDLTLRLEPVDVSERVSIKDVLKIHDATNALKFLRERWDLGLDKIVEM